MTERPRRVSINERLHYIPEKVLCVFVVECVKNFVVKENLGDSITAKAHALSRLAQRVSWGDDEEDVKSYEIYIPEKYRRAFYIKKQDVSLSQRDKKRLHAYRMMESCLWMIGRIASEKINNTRGSSGLSFSVASDVARMCRNFDGKRDAEQTHWQRDMLDKIGQFSPISSILNGVTQKWLATYAEIIVWKWVSCGRTVGSGVVDLVTIMRAETADSGATILNKTSDFRRQIRLTVCDVHSCDPDSNFDLFIEELFRLWVEAGYYKVDVRSCCFGYLDEWIGARRTSEAVEESLSAIGRIGRDGVLEIDD